jgi:O-antigen/teichoic acid export membrane protein
MLVSLYTVRVVLETLGAEDYGIYNVVAGVVTMFGFLSSSMAGASQRYLSFEIGRGDFERLKTIFSLSLTIFILIAVIIVLLAETVGLWFITNKLIIPNERRIVAYWVYQFSIISFVFTILTTPYMASIIAHEDMNIYAYVSIVEAMLKLGVVLVLNIITFDKLQIYGILLCITTFINTAIYRIICTAKYKECQFKIYWNNTLFKDIIGYTGWTLLSVLADILKKQGITILLNQMFNPFVVSARSIAFTITSAVNNFFNQFMMALRPQIVKSYASKQTEKMLLLVFIGIKGDFFLMYLFALPLFFEMNMILSLWLKNPAEYVALFTRLMLIDLLIDGINYPIGTAVQATGNMKLFQTVSSIMFLLNFPISLIVLSTGAPAYSVLIVAIVLTCIAFIIRLIVFKRLINISIRQFFQKTIMPICLVAVLSIIFPAILCHIMAQSIIRLCIVTIISIISICCSMYFVGLNNIERQEINRIIKHRIRAYK